MYELTSGVAVDRPNRDRNRDRDVAVRGNHDRAPGFEKSPYLRGLLFTRRVLLNDPMDVQKTFVGLLS